MGSPKFFEKSYCDLVSVFCARCVDNAQKSVACLTQLSILNNVDINSQEGINNSQVLISSQDRAKINSGKFFPIEKDYDSFEKIFISADKKTSSVIKYDLIKNCDFYILIGKIGNFRVDDLTNTKSV